MKKYIYLAGPVEGCNKGEANDWRNNVKARLIEGIIGISPVRCEAPIKKKYGGVHNNKSAAAVNGKNKFDVMSADLILAYLPREINERRPSYGTVWELGWASDRGKPIILVTDDPYVAGHPLFTENISWIVDNFDDAIDIIHGLFEDYVKDPTQYTCKDLTLDYTGPVIPHIQDEI